MHQELKLAIAAAGMAFLFTNAGRADVPAPPVEQTIGMYDRAFRDMTEADCRSCHDSGVGDRHNALYGDPVPPPGETVAPYPPGPNRTYVCLTCHIQNSDGTFRVETDCTVCHVPSAAGSSGPTSPHHTAATALGGDCQDCHGSFVDNMDDGHYIPTYTPSLVTPSTSGGDGLPLNSRDIGAGACTYCHDEGTAATPQILVNSVLHHDGSRDCAYCHDMHASARIRRCEGCHGPDSLHNIQADSNGGGIDVGGELAGYGHVGRDAGAGDSDCWGCHGFQTASVAPGSGPIIPTLYGVDVTVLCAGTETLVVLTGAAFTNTLGHTLYESDVRLTADDGARLTLTPDILVDQGKLAVTLPDDLAPGNYKIQVTKEGFVSNPAVITILPKVRITAVTVRDAVTIIGNGFGGHPGGAGTHVTGRVCREMGQSEVAASIVEATIVSWTDTKIVADFGPIPNEITVHSVFGSATSEVKAPKPHKSRSRRRSRSRSERRSREGHER